MLSAIIEATPNAVYIKDEDGKYLMINEKGAASVGLQVEDFIGKNDLEVFPKELGEKVMELDRSVFSGKPHNGLEVIDDEQVFYSHKFVVEDDETGNRVMAGISTDISELKKVERELLEARSRAEEANRHKSTFLQNMSHELRTPLNAIIGFSSMLMGEDGTNNKKFDENNYREYAKLINSSGVHLLSIINDLLDLSKIEAGEQDFNEVDIDMNYVIESSILTLKSVANERNITFEEYLPSQNIILKGDERILRQLIYNLLSNAIKYSNPNGTVKIKMDLGTDGDLVIAIIDEGIGMSKADLETAMLPFRRVAQVKESNISGTGLGLPLADAFIKMFQGFLEIESDLGLGTTVILNFPKDRIIIEE